MKLIIIACAFLFVGCGSSGTTPLDGATPAQGLGELSQLEKTIYTEGYAGYLVVHLKEEARTQGGKEAGNTPPSPSPLPQNGGEGVGEGVLQPIISAHPTAILKRSVSTPPEQLDARRRYLERISGKTLTDFNLIYHVEVADPDEAVRVMRELQSMGCQMSSVDPDVANVGCVEKVYPKRKAYVTTLATVPDLTGAQGYLYADETNGGLNAQAAWDAGARGAGVVVVDAEYEWNFDHEDLNLELGVDNWSAVGCYPTVYPECVADFAHGTAVVGIIAAQDNGHGTTGFAPEADLKTKGSDPEGFPILFDGEGSLYDPLNREVPPGTILVIETQHAGRLSPDGFCSGFAESDQYGCVPLETDPENFAAIEIATSAGAIVIEGSGNGSVDLGDPATYWPYEITLYDHDSGSILVGGSQGSNHQKISFSNYGSPVDAYAWAQGVVTTAYPYGGPTGPYYWDTAASDPDPPNDDNNAYYTNRFGGTSSATAMVAGAAALVQSYAKNVMGETTRYLMPLKLREILVTTGITQSGGGGNIGRQPRIDRAIAQVDVFWANISSAYPELTSGASLTEEEMIELRNLGLGIMCGELDPETHTIVGPHDPSCPEIVLWPPGTMIAKSLDFDGDRRADLVSWTNGQWKVDLSSVGSGGDNYGSWDLILNYTPISSRWVWPYVEDYNSDGREDFAVYDKEHGKWYIAFTDSNLLNTGIWPGWDWEIDYSAEWTDVLRMDPWNSDYSRPAPGDYDGDGWMDIAIACSDGYWRIDYGGANRSDYGVFNQNVQYLDEARLRDAPGWAYLVVQRDGRVGRITYKVPDGLPEEGRLIIYRAQDPSFDLCDNDLYDVHCPHMFEGNDHIPFVVQGNGWYVALKNTEDWLVVSDELTLEHPEPKGIWGKLDCRPVIADFDGDDIDDRAVMCPDEWRIARSTAPGTLTTIGLGYDTRKWSLPGRSYSGGLSYFFVQQLIAYAQDTNPTQPPPIPVDMATMNVCSLPVDDPEGECN